MSWFVIFTGLNIVLTHSIPDLVYSLFLVETVQTLMVTNGAFEWFAYGFGNMKSLSKPYTTSIGAPAMDGLIALAVQLFFSWRIWVCSSSIDETPRSDLK